MKLCSVIVSLFLALLVGLLPQVGEAASGNISTVLGEGVGGTSFLEPSGIAVDSAGNLYVADASQHRVYKRSAGGTVTTVAGTGTATATGANPGDGGPATAATLNTPTSVAVDAAGNLYIADRKNHRVRKVAAGTGIITTIAGNGSKTFAGDGGQATSASLYYPSGVALDSAGNVYIADFFNNRIRKVTAATGIITTVAGNGASAYGGDGGAATSASIYGPWGVAVDSSGNIYVADLFNNRVRKVTAGTISTVAGGGEATSYDGPATAAKLEQPAGIAIDASGNFFIAAQTSNRIFRVDASTGTISVAAGNGTAAFAGDGGTATNASLNVPSGVAVDSSKNIYIADKGNKRVRLVQDVPEVVVSPAGGKYSSAQQVRLTASSAATIYYTVDGSDPTTSSTRQSFSSTGTISIATNTTVKYYAVEADGGTTVVATQFYNMVAGAPTAVTATAANGEATVSFTPPAFTGGRPIVSYTVISSPGDITVADLIGPITLTGLSNGTTYTFSVYAETDAGWGFPGVSNAVTPGASAPPEYTLSLQISGNGSGSVNGAITCVSGETCPSATYNSVQQVTLTASPTAGSVFTGWSGACSGTANCTVTTDGAKAVTATFTALPAQVRIVGKNGFALLADALAAAASGDTIQARAGDFVENIVLDEQKTVTLKGGYDEAFANVTGTTKIDGKLTIRQGKLLLERIVVK